MGEVEEEAAEVTKKDLAALLDGLKGFAYFGLLFYT